MARRTLIPSALAGALLVAACSTSADVEVRSAGTAPDTDAPASPSATDTAPATPATTAVPVETSPTTPTEPEPPTEPPASTASPTHDNRDVLNFQLTDFRVDVSRRPTIAETPPGGYDGFQSAIELDDGTFVASGFDARGDGLQPERSALWRSVDGEMWDRVGEPVGAAFGQQQIAAMFLDDSEVHLISIDLDIEFADDGTTDVQFGPSVEWASDDGVGWGSRALVGNNAIGGTHVIDGEIVAYGAVRPNSDDYRAAILRPISAGGDWTSTDFVDAAGAHFPRSIVSDMVTMDNTIIAVGATAETDPVSSLTSSVLDITALSGPADVAVWRSDDNGATWTAMAADEFAGRTGPAVGTSVVEIDGSLFLLARTVEAYQTTVVVHRSDDLGETWERVRVEKALASDVGNTTELTNTGLYAVDGFLVMFEERSGFEQEMFMSVIDAATGESVTESLTAALAVVQIEDVLDIDDGAVGFGRQERGAAASDLQVIDIRRVDSATASSNA